MMDNQVTFACGLCQSQVPMGARVCTGCQGTVLYGATPQELNMYPMLPALLVFFVVMFFFDMSTRWHASVALGLAVVAFVVARNLIRSQRASMIRTFRRM
ncbi:MAG TPA: hypothetical protein VMB73_34450 [Acetobacteraceae bacterium]|nr:hypothetical protein [Acetobacteraceae bacterium]